LKIEIIEILDLFRIYRVKNYVDAKENEISETTEGKEKRGGLPRKYPQLW
jgi:hypothetical protein